MSERHGRHRHNAGRVAWSPGSPLEGLIPDTVKRATPDRVAAQQASPVSCSCGWIGSLGQLTASGKCPGCRSSKNLARL